METLAPELAGAVRRALPAADEETVLVVAAIAGLLGAVAYADGVYDPREAQQVERELGRVQGLGPDGIAAIRAALEQRLVDLATVDVARSARVLRELADADLRRETLAVLLRVAAADGSISQREVNTLRNVTQALGLTQRDYNELQREHRALLAVLNSDPT